jgi:hypothetical protein
MDVRSNLAFSGGAKVTGLPASTAAGEPVVHEQLQSAINGLAWKDNCRVATQANVSIASPGATIDGITMVTGDRVLARVQTTTSENGIYIWNGAATPMTRAADADAYDELESAVVTVDEGTSAGATFRQSGVNGTIGSTAVTWTSFGTSAPAASESTAGVAELATQAEVNTGTDALRIVTPATLASWSGRIRKFSQLFGDGSATQYDITHNLNSTQVQVEVFVESTGATVLCDVTRTTVNVARLNFAAAPASNTLRVVVIG